MIAQKGPYPMLRFPSPTRFLTCSVLVGVLVLAGCSFDDSPSPAEERQFRTVEAANGVVDVPAHPRAVAVLWRPTLSAVTQLGHEVVATMGTPGSPDQGLGPFLPEEVNGADLNVVTNSPSENDVNIEELANAAPDLIIGVHTQFGAQSDMVQTLEEIAPTVLLEWKGTGSWREHLQEVAEVLGAEDRPRSVVAEYEQAVEQARQDIVAAGVDPARTELPLVRLQDENEIRLETSASFPGQVVEDLGFARPRVQEESDGDIDYIPLSHESLDQADGDVMFVLAGSGYPEAPETFSEGVWTGLSAVQQERVFRADQDVWGSATYYAAHSIVEEITAALVGQKEPAV